MKVCFIGTGSIGQRHILNLSTVCSENNHDLEIHLLRSSTKPLPNDFSKYKHVYCDNKLDTYYDAIFVTNPTHLHYACIKKYKNLSKHFFIEKPLFADPQADIDDLRLPMENKYYIACPLRYTRVLASARNLLKHREVFCASAISSSYLPGWRPNTDYTKSYSARHEQGGGVRLDLIHELDYLIDMFGFPGEVSAMCGKYSTLHINSEDLALYILRYPEKLVSIHLDYFGRQPLRCLTLYTEDSTLVYDIISSTVQENGVLTQCFNEDPNKKYLREMQNFYNIVVHNHASNNTLENSLRVLRIASCTNRKLGD